MRNEPESPKTLKAMARYIEASEHIATVQHHALKVLEKWRTDYDLRWDNFQPDADFLEIPEITDWTIALAVRKSIDNSPKKEKLKNLVRELRGFAEHLLQLGDRQIFRTDPSLLFFLLSDETQKRYLDALPKTTSSQEPLVDVHGYDFWRVTELSHFATQFERLRWPENIAPTSEQKDALTEAIRFSLSKNGSVLIPDARHDEMLMEIFTATWLALFFLGERHDGIWSVVARIATNDTGGLPTGCALYKACGDVYRDVRETAEELLFRTGSERFLDSNFRIRAIVRWPALLGEEDFAIRQERQPFDLTPSSYRSLGAMYMYWQALRYVRRQLPITLLMRQSVINQIEASDKFVEARGWLRLAFGHPSLPYRGPVSAKMPSTSNRGVVWAYTHQPWGEVRGDDLGTYRNLYESRHTVVAAVDDTAIDSLDLHNAVVGPRFGSASAGRVLNPAKDAAKSGTGPVFGDLPFSGRRLFGDLLASYNYAFRQLSRQAADPKNARENGYAPPTNLLSKLDVVHIDEAHQTKPVDANPPESE